MQDLIICADAGLYPVVDILNAEIVDVCATLEDAIASYPTAALSSRLQYRNVTLNGDMANEFNDSFHDDDEYAVME